MSLIIQQLRVALELQQTCNTKPLWSLWGLQKCLQIARGTYLGGIDTPPERFGFTATLGLALFAAGHPTLGNHRNFCHNWIKQKLLIHTFSILEMMADSVHSQTCQTEVHPILCRPRSWEGWYSGIATCWDEYHIRCPPDFSTGLHQTEECMLGDAVQTIAGKSFKP